jgi:hypothetical protein
MLMLSSATRWPYGRPKPPNVDSGAAVSLTLRVGPESSLSQL